MSGDLRFEWLHRGARGPDARPVLVVDGLTARVGIRRVLDGLSFEVHEGDQLVLLGPNGAGKSTLFNALAGTGSARIESGTIRFCGRDITHWPAHLRAALGISYMPQSGNVFGSLTGAENLELSLGARGTREFESTFPTWAGALSLDRRAGQFSGGEQKKLAWAMAVLRPSRLLLLDEPWAGMAEAPEIPPGRTVMIATHDWKMGVGPDGKAVAQPTDRNW
jgi:branched-chain amino acid transport system ATP-binding protein